MAVHDPRVFGALREDILSEPNGHLFFAHVLLPHPPFAFLHDCSVSYQSDRLYRSSAFSNEHDLNDSVYEVRNNLYFEQMDCALLSLRQIFYELQKNSVFERSIIVIHGDHGSLIANVLPRVQNLDKLTTEHYRAHYSTLFAVRFPQTEFSVDDRALPLNALMEGYSRSIQQYVTKGSTSGSISGSVPVDTSDLESYVYLLGSIPMQRVEIDIFEKKVLHNQGN